MKIKNKVKIFSIDRILYPRNCVELNSRFMRPLTEDETKVLFEKLANYIGRNISHLIDTEEPYTFYIQKDRVYYVKKKIMQLACSIKRPNLLSMGTCIGKFTKTGKFRLHITSLDIIAPYSSYKIWVKANGEMPLLYGNNVLKAHIGKQTDSIPEHQGVIFYSMNDVPLGFGVSAKSSIQIKQLDPTAIAAFRQADCGEYLREEDTLFVQ